MDTRRRRRVRHRPRRPWRPRSNATAGDHRPRATWAGRHEPADDGTRRRTPGPPTGPRGPARCGRRRRRRVRREPVRRDHGHRRRRGRVRGGPSARPGARRPERRSNPPHVRSVAGQRRGGARPPPPNSASTPTPSGIGSGGWRRSRDGCCRIPGPSPNSPSPTRSRGTAERRWHCRATNGGHAPVRSHLLHHMACR